MSLTQDEKADDGWVMYTGTLYSSRSVDRLPVWATTPVQVTSSTHHTSPSFTGRLGVLVDLRETQTPSALLRQRNVVTGGTDLSPEVGSFQTS